jgi:ribosome hibernation promoting factor
MINLQISGRSYELNAKLTDYIGKKIGAIDKYLPRQVRRGLQGDVVVALDPSGREGNQCVCEVVINVPNGRLQAKEATLNMYAAVDIVEAKLKAQAHRYKDKHAPQTRRHALWNRLTRRAPAPELESDQ